MASLGALLLLLAFVTAAYSVAAAVVGARRRNTRLIESAIGAFYTIAAIMTVASGVIIYAFVAGDYSIRYVRRYSDSVQPLFYKITSVLGRPRRLGDVLGVPAVALRSGGGEGESRASSRADSLRRRGDRRSGDVLPLPDGDSQQPVHDLSDGVADRRPRPESAAAELLHGDPSADDVSRLRRADDPVRVRHGGALHRPSR